MAEELFKNQQAAPKATTASPTNPAQPKQPEAPATDINQTSSGPSSVTPPITKTEGAGDPAQTTQKPGDAPQASASGSVNEFPDDEPVEEDEQPEQPSELDMLKKRAKLMGISHSPNIGVDALKEKIQQAMEGPAKTVTQQEQKNVQNDDNVKSQQNSQTNALTGQRKEKKISLRQYLQSEKMKLVRVRITNLDPKKKDLPGEIITVANEYLGTVRKYVPFGEVTDNGYHIPQCIYDLLKARTFVSIKTRRGSKGEEIVEHQNAREFALEILPPLTADELAKLGAAQQAAGGL